MIKGEDNNMLERPVVKIAPDTYLVSEYKLVNMFLVVGKHRAALIDTGGGIGRCRKTSKGLQGFPSLLLRHTETRTMWAARAISRMCISTLWIGNTAAVSR